MKITIDRQHEKSSGHEWPMAVMTSAQRGMARTFSLTQNIRGTYRRASLRTIGLRHTGLTGPPRVQLSTSHGLCHS